MHISKKYINKGYDALNDLDILELLLYISGYKKTTDKANELFNNYGTLENILHIEEDNSLNERFIVVSKFVKDFATKHLFNKLKEKKVNLHNSQLVVDYIKSIIAYDVVENFIVIYLTTNFDVIQVSKPYKGTIDKTYVFLRPIIKKALICNAKNILIAHNHPSGCLKPSNSDIELTQKLKESLSLFEITLIDHVVVSREGHYSFVERGLL